MEKAELRARAISTQVLDYIRLQGLKSGDQLPTENDMAGELGINRSTLREVYVRMVGQGLIVRQHGMGTFVGQAPIKDGAVPEEGFAGRIGAAGFEATVDLISVERVPLDQALAQAFGCASGMESSRLVRVFRANGSPAVLIKDHFAPHIDARCIDMARHGLEMIAGLHTQVDMSGARMDTSTTAVALSGDKAKLLGLSEGSPALHSYTIIHAATGGVIAVAWVWLHPGLVEVKSSRVVTLNQPPRLAVPGEVWPVQVAITAPPSRRRKRSRHMAS